MWIYSFFLYIFMNALNIYIVVKSITFFKCLFCQWGGKPTLFITMSTREGWFLPLWQQQIIKNWLRHRSGQKRSAEKSIYSISPSAQTGVGTLPNLETAWKEAPLSASSHGCLSCSHLWVTSWVYASVPDSWMNGFNRGRQIFWTQRRLGTPSSVDCLQTLAAGIRHLLL